MFSDLVKALERVFNKIVTFFRKCYATLCKVLNCSKSIKIPKSYPQGYPHYVDKPHKPKEVFIKKPYWIVNARSRC